MDEGALSLFIAVYSCSKRQVSLIQLKTPQQQEEDDLVKNLDDYEVVRFIPPNGDAPLIRWYVSPSATDDFYIFPSCPWLPPLHSYKFNFMTASFRKIKPPQAPKDDAFVVNLGRQHTYFICALNCETQIDFECYNAYQDKWEALKLFPDCPIWSRIVATAAWGDTILFNFNIRTIWAYNVRANRWYHVQVDGMRCYGIVGNTVVLQDSSQDTTTIYALADGNEFSFGTVLALSIKIKGSYADLVYKCSLHSEVRVRPMDRVLDYGDRVWMPTSNLVHLGKHNFCLVNACTVKGFKVYLYIQLTYMLLTGKKSEIVMERYHKLNIQDREYFDVVHCFFLPECKATALGRGKRLDFQLDPHEYQSVYVRNLPFDATVEQVEEGLKVFGPIVRVRDGIQVQNKKKKSVAFVEFESAASKQDAIKAGGVLIGDCWAEIYDKSRRKSKKNHPHSSDEVHSVYVSNLPRHATVEEVEKELNVFGPIVKDGIQVNIKKKTKVFAFVEFQSAASKQCAIEAKIVFFGGRRANIYDRKMKTKMKKNQPHSSGMQMDGQSQ